MTALEWVTYIVCGAAFIFAAWAGFKLSQPPPCVWGCGRTTEECGNECVSPPKEEA